MEKELEKLQKYKQELLNYFLEHYQEYQPEKTQELEDTTRRLADKEEAWLRLTTELEEFKNS